MVVFFIVLALILGLVLLRAFFPSDFRINKRYLARFLKDKNGNGPKTVSVTPLSVAKPPGTPEERTYYDVRATFSDGSSQDVLIQVFYPLEIYYQEKEKNDRAASTEEANPNSMTSIGSPASSSDMEKYREDPFKDLSEEERVKQAKEKELAAEVRQLKLLGASATVYPTVIAFDPKQHITIAESIGNERLDDVLSRLSTGDKEELLGGLLEDLARFHNLGDAVALQLLPGDIHTEGMVQAQLMSSFEAWKTLGIQVSPAERLDLQDAIVPLYVGLQAFLGPKMGDSAPRAFFVQNGKAKSADWGRARRDVSAIDVIELVCDPVVGLEAEAEKRLFARYVAERSLDHEQKESLEKRLSRLAIYYRIALLSYLGQYFVALKSMSAQKRKTFEVKYWSADALPTAIDNLNEYLATDEGLSELNDLLTDKLAQIRLNSDPA